MAAFQFSAVQRGDLPSTLLFPSDSSTLLIAQTHRG